MKWHHGLVDGGGQNVLDQINIPTHHLFRHGPTLNANTAINKGMALYPIIEPDLDDYHRYVVPSGTCYVFPISIADEEIKKIILMHTHIQQQDHSLRAWVSTEVGGVEIIHYPLEVGIWHPNRSPHQIIAIYDQGYVPPEDVAASIPVELGTYYLHVLNLTNRENSFSYFLDDAG